MTTKKNITIALGGGGARGFAHLGVLQVLESHYRIQAIAGTSMGALVGGVYAQLGNVDEAIAHFRNNLERMQNHTVQTQVDPLFDDFSINFRNQMLLHNAEPEQADAVAGQLAHAISTLLQKEKIENTKIPFVAIASDALSGREIVLADGDIQQAVLASSALPGVMAPVQWQDKLLIDGAATSAVPIRAARKFADHFVIASDVSAALVAKKSFKNAAELFIRNLQIISRHYHDELVNEADLLIVPQVGEKPWNDFEHFDWFVEQGRIAAQTALIN